MVKNGKKHKQVRLEDENGGFGTYYVPAKPMNNRMFQGYLVRFKRTFITKHSKNMAFHSNDK